MCCYFCYKRCCLCDGLKTKKHPTYIFSSCTDTADFRFCAGRRSLGESSATFEEICSLLLFVIYVKKNTNQKIQNISERNSLIILLQCEKLFFDLQDHQEEAW